MSSKERRERLQFKTLGLEHLSQFNELLRYVFQVTNRELQDSGYEEGEFIRAHRPILEKAEVIGWFNGDKLVSQLSIYPCEVNIHGRIFQMGGLTGVGTYPEYANLRLMSDLIKIGLERMRDKQQWISYLCPYSIPFYRKKGWEILSERVTFRVKDSQLPGVVDIPGFVERLPVLHPDVIATYERFARKNHGAMLRGEIEWEEYWRWENEDERTAALYYAGQGKPLGYILYWIEKDIFHIKEMVYLTQEARLGLWNFISAHYSMINRVEGDIYKNAPVAFLLDDSQITEVIEPYAMARIVDVAAFLSHYPFARTGKPFHFIVSDPVAEWNQGTFGVSWNGKNVEVSREPCGKPVSLSIRALTAMLMGFRPPSFFHEIHQLETDARTLALLEDIIPNVQPYFSDYF